MNILIENAESLEYLANDGQWTKNASAGKNFGNTGVALAAAKMEMISTFNIVSYIPLTEQFVNLGHGKGKAPAKTSPV
jgi:hypothetical protein